MMPKRLLKRNLKVRAMIHNEATKASPASAGSRRDTSMVTAPRDGRLLILHRYGQPRIFVGRWVESDGWWHDESGKRMTHVHSWEPHRGNAKGEP